MSLAPFHLTDALPDRQELVDLYTSVGWAAYTHDPESLVRAVANSTWVSLARDAEGGLVGLVRVISDDVSIAWLQDILVHPDHQRAGIGRALVDRAIARFQHVRSIALMTDDEPRQHSFYQALGFTELREAADGQLHAFLRLKR